MTPPEDEPPGLPLVRTWRRAYVLVLGVLAAWILLLAALGRSFP
jgi:hypothetical protein